jgi:hypothetical protein
MAFTSGHDFTSPKMSLFDGLKVRWIIFSPLLSDSIYSLELTTLILIFYTFSKIFLAEILHMV